MSKVYDLYPEHDSHDQYDQNGRRRSKASLIAGSIAAAGAIGFGVFAASGGLNEEFPTEPDFFVAGLVDDTFDADVVAGVKLGCQDTTSRGKVLSIEADVVTTRTHGGTIAQDKLTRLRHISEHLDVADDQSCDQIIDNAFTDPSSVIATVEFEVNGVAARMFGDGGLYRAEEYLSYFEDAEAAGDIPVFEFTTSE